MPLAMTGRLLGHKAKASVSEAISHHCETVSEKF